MKKLFLAALAVAAALPMSALAQDAPTSVHPSARNLLTDQLDQLSARIDRRLARGRLSQQDADRAHREVNDLQAEISDDRLKNGGQLTEADRFDLQARVRQLRAEIDAKRATGGGAPPH